MFELGGYTPMIIGGLKNTLLVGCLSMLLATVYGILGAIAYESNNRILRYSARTYTLVIRGVPELILLLLVFYGAPQLIRETSALLGFELNVQLDPFVAGTLTIAFIYGAFCTEVFRGAFNSIPKGQAEAARALGMSTALIYRKVLIPQAAIRALPGLSNVWMILVKATALISVIQLEEVMRMTKIAANATREPFTAYFFASLLFLGITVLSMLGQRMLEKRYEHARLS